MARQVDVKALVSHVVRGDGINRCRICMGDTSEGQVHLNDTVLTDGDRPVTLSELLEIVTGIKVAEETELPVGLCSYCSTTAIASWQFRQLCLESDRKWTSTTLSLLKPKLKIKSKDKTAYIGCNVLIKDSIESQTSAEAIERLNILIGYKKRTRNKKRLGQRSDLYKCKDCGQEFALPASLNTHLMSTNKRACTICGKIVSKSLLARHLKLHNKIVMDCSICHKLFDEQTKLDDHTEMLHGVNLLHCNVCKNGFKNERSLASHMYSHTLFDCSGCNASFKNRRCYLYHSKNCVGGKCFDNGKYECHDCGIVYAKKPSLRVHIEQKHLHILPFVCQICGKRSSTKSHLVAHELIHKTERKTYVCHCGAKMTTEVGLTMHQRIHSGEKPYKCEICGDRFLSASRRLDHEKRKHRSKAHSCEKCDAKFIRPFELKRHYRSIHMISG